MIEPQPKAAYHPEAHTYLAEDIQKRGTHFEFVYILHSSHTVVELGVKWLLLFSSPHEYRGTSLLLHDCRLATGGLDRGQVLTQVVSKYSYPAPFFGRSEQLVLAVFKGNDRHGQVLFNAPGFNVDRYRQGSQNSLI